MFKFILFKKNNGANFKEAKLLSLERDLEEIKSKLAMPNKTNGDGTVCKLNNLSKYWSL